MHREENGRILYISKENEFHTEGTGQRERAQTAAQETEVSFETDVFVHEQHTGPTLLEGLISKRRVSLIRCLTRQKKKSFSCINVTQYKQLYSLTTR